MGEASITHLAPNATYHRRMRNMSSEEWRAFVSYGTRTGKLATVRADGRPHVTPIWFLLDNDDVVFTTSTRTVKGRALRRDPRASLCVDDQELPYSFVLIEGAVSLNDNLDELLLWATKLGARYMGSARAVEFGRRNAVPGEMLVRLRPDRVIAQADLAE